MEAPANKLLCAATVFVALALPANAVAESIVPPENSAATQYTEAIPTGGGQQAATGNGRTRSPSSVLGKKKAKKLDARGPQGRATARTAAETAPRPLPNGAEAAPGPAKPRQPESAAHRAGGSHGTASAQAPDVEAPPRLDASGGASGPSEVLGQVGGFSSGGELGSLLPLLILATVVWALVYRLRRRRAPA